MEAAALLAKNPTPTAQQIKSNMNHVLCRCGTYPRIMKAIQMAIQRNERDKKN
jgi:isoquinoline 1-oxidoreductase alpha subunit